MDQYYEICNINIIVQIWMCPCGDGRSSVEYLSCIFVMNIYAVYFGLDFLLNIYINTIYIITHGNFLVNILCQCAVVLVPMHRWAMSACWRVCYADMETCQWEKWKSCYTWSFIHHLCADASMSANMLCQSGDAPVAKMERPQN